MSFTKPEFPDVDPDTFLQKPLMERMRILALNWAENGFGSPRMIHVIYIAKLVLFYALGAIVAATLTSGLPAFWHVSQWWNQPIVYEKAILWTVLLELLNVAGSWGPLAGKVKPMTGASCSGHARAPSGYGRGSGCPSPPVTGAPVSTSHCMSRCSRASRLRCFRPACTVIRCRR